MTKKKTTVLIPAGSNAGGAAPSVEVLDDAPKSVDMQALVAMGVDMKLSKNDIIEYATEMMAEQVKERLAAAGAQLKRIKDSFNSEVEKRIESVKNDSKFIEFVESINKLKEVSTISNNYCYQEHKDTTGSFKLIMKADDSDTHCVFGYTDLDYFLDETVEKVSLYVVMIYGGLESKYMAKVMDAAELKPYSVSRLAAKKEYDEAVAQSHKLENATKKVRIELTKAILQNSDKGRELLKFLDSSSKSRLKALASKNA